MNNTTKHNISIMLSLSIIFMMIAGCSQQAQEDVMTTEEIKARQLEALEAKKAEQKRIIEEEMHGSTNVCDSENVTNIVETKSIDTSDVSEDAVNDNQSWQQSYDIDNTIDTSDWLTYTNEEYGFKVQYPKHWTVHEIIDGQPDVDGNIVDCSIIPTGCPIVRLSDDSDDFGHDSITINIRETFSPNTVKTTQWHGIVSEISGCFVVARKPLNETQSFSFRSIYDTTDLNDDLQTDLERAKCQNDEYNPYFNAVLNSFTEK